MHTMPSRSTHNSVVHLQITEADWLLTAAVEVELDEVELTVMIRTKQFTFIDT